MVYLGHEKQKKMRKVCENLWTNPCGFISFKKYMKNIRQSQRLIQWLNGKMRFFSKIKPSLSLERFRN